MDEPDCYACRKTVDPAAPEREHVVRTRHWRVAHAFDTALRGWLVVLPTRHLTALDELDEEAAAELGPLLTGLTAALKAVTGCAKTYVALFAEAEGFAHLHLHVVPRAPDLDPRFRGPAVFGLLGAAEADRVPPDARDRLAVRLRAAMPGLPQGAQPDGLP